MSVKSSALSLIVSTGEQVTWEITKCEGHWYVWAAHRGEDFFKFSAAGKTLTGCIRSVYDDLMKHGPEWVRK